ncbi:hypothetical protein JCM1393_16140 [Clostridium carnis]
MKVPKIEEFMGMSMNKEILKKAIGDGPEFEIVYEALLKEMESKKDSIGDDSNENNIITPTGTGQRIDTIPMRMRKESILTGELFLDSEGNNRLNESRQAYNYKASEYADTSIKEVSSEEKKSNIDKIYSAVDKYSTKYGVDKKLILAIIKQESNFDPNVVSSAGAMGVMQLMDFNVEAYGVTDPFDIEQNVEGGVRHIKEYLDMFDGNKEMALMAYNGGPGNMARRGVNSPTDLYKMPSETQHYVPKVMNYYRNGF